MRVELARALGSGSSTIAASCVELGGQVERGADQHDRLHALGEQLEQVAQPAQRDRVGELPVRVEDREERGLGRGRDRAQAVVERARAVRRWSRARRRRDQVTSSRLHACAAELQRRERALLLERLEGDQRASPP